MEKTTTGEENPFEILGIHPFVGRNLSTEQLRRYVAFAFRGMMEIYHPDKGGDPEIAKRINEAFKKLKDPQQFGFYKSKWIGEIPRPISPTKQAHEVLRKTAESLRKKVESLEELLSDWQKLSLKESTKKKHYIYHDDFYFMGKYNESENELFKVLKNGQVEIWSPTKDSFQRTGYQLIGSIPQLEIRQQTTLPRTLEDAVEQKNEIGPYAEVGRISILTDKEGNIIYTAIRNVSDNESEAKDEYKLRELKIGFKLQEMEKLKESDVNSFYKLFTKLCQKKKRFSSQERLTLAQEISAALSKNLIEPIALTKKEEEDLGLMGYLLTRNKKYRGLMTRRIHAIEYLLGRRGLPKISKPQIKRKPPVRPPTRFDDLCTRLGIKGAKSKDSLSRDLGRLNLPRLGRGKPPEIKIRSKYLTKDQAEHYVFFKRWCSGDSSAIRELLNYMNGEHYYPDKEFALAKYALGAFSISGDEIVELARRFEDISKYVGAKTLNEKVALGYEIRCALGVPKNDPDELSEKKLRFLSPQVYAEANRRFRDESVNRKFMDGSLYLSSELGKSAK